MKRNNVQPSIVVYQNSMNLSVVDLYFNVQSEIVRMAKRLIILFRELKVMRCENVANHCLELVWIEILRKTHCVKGFLKDLLL